MRALTTTLNAKIDELIETSSIEELTPNQKQQARAVLRRFAADVVEAAVSFSELHIGSCSKLALGLLHTVHDLRLSARQ